MEAHIICGLGGPYPEKSRTALVLSDIQIYTNSNAVSGFLLESTKYTYKIPGHIRSFCKVNRFQSLNVLDGFSLNICEYFVP